VVEKPQRWYGSAYVWVSLGRYGRYILDTIKLQAVVAIGISVNYLVHPTSVLLVSTAGKPSRSLLNFGGSMVAVGLLRLRIQ